MYSFLLRHLGSKWAFWLCVGWYAVLIMLVLISFGGPVGEFRYGNLK